MKKIMLLMVAMTFVAALLAGCTSSSSEERNSSKNESIITSNEPSSAVNQPFNVGNRKGSINMSSIKTKYIDVAYGKQSKSQKMDIYLPNEGNGPFPVIVAVHGGGFSKGDKREKGIASMLEGVNRGYAVVSINYRLSGEAKFPAAISDVKAAVRYIKANAKKYNLDPNKIAMWGNSAGGNLVALAGTSGDDSSLNGDNTENLKYSSKIQAVVDWFGPIDFLKLDEQFAKSEVTPKMGKRSTDTSIESKYIGGNIAENVKQTEKANPSNYITKNDPYFFIQHGSADRIVPTQQSIDFSEKLTNVLGKEKVKLSILKGADHGGKQFNSKENLDNVFRFLDSVLK
ncbi:alpha/beta hydrolase fold domain-containing protein [Rummeliibacillus sp. JY-2-4R]